MTSETTRPRARAVLAFAWQFAFALSLAVGLAACGGGGSGGGSGSSAGTPPPAAAPTTVASAPTSSSLAGVPLDTTPAHPVISLSSDAGDFVGGGNSYAYDDDNARITVQNDGTHLHITVQGNQNWDGNFQLPNAVSQWQVGTYTGLIRYPFNSAATGGMDWTGQGHGCNQQAATVKVNSVRYDGAVLSAINLDFEQHCEGAAPALRGHVDWDSQRPVTPALPVNPIPTDLWAPTASQMPSTSNAMFFISDPQDFIGQGWSYTVTGGSSSGTSPPADTTRSAALAITETAGLLRITLTGTNVTWDAEFKAMDGLAHLQPGYYGIVQRYPFHNPRRGGLSVSMDGRGCNTLNGWFAVDNIVYSGDKVVAADLRFAQYCDNLVNALRGRIRWSLVSTQNL